MDRSTPMFACLARIAFWVTLIIAIASCQPNPTATPKPVLPTPIPAATASPTAISGVILNPEVESADTVIRLSWQPVTGASGYFVFRDNGSTPLNPTPIAEPHFEDIGLTNGRIYTYTIAAVGQGGQVGPHSAPIQAIPKSH